MRRFRSPAHSAPRAKGFALIAFVLLLTLVSAYLIAAAFSSTSSELSSTREDRNMNALRQAKAALIAYAASEQWQKYKGEVTKQPGALPCPDILHDGTESDEGNSDCVTPLTSSLIGRLPYKTLGINDLRDASGEQLWYALSAKFRKVSGITVINSDTQPCDTPACNAGESHLTVTGIAPVSNVVAIVFAPGLAIQGQIRSSTPTDAVHNLPANYIESLVQVDAIHFTVTTTALPSDTLNDRLLTITQAELMAAVEPVVAARIERDIKPFIFNTTGGNSYFEQWGAFPFPATFASPNPGTSGVGTTRAQNAYVGDTTQVGGLLPISASLTYPWTAGSGTATLTGGIAGSISGVSCNTVALPGWQCGFTIDSIDLGPNPANWGPCTDGGGVPWRYCEVNPRFRVQGAIGANAGKSFAKLPNASAVTVTDATSAPRSMSSTAINGTLTSAGVGTVIFQGTWASSEYNSSSFSRSMVVTIPDVVVSPVTNAADPNAGWFIANEWYRQLYYAVAPDLVPGGNGNCTVNPPCLTVKNLASPNNNKKAILVFAGRALNGSNRPSANPKDYLEGENCNLAAGKDLDPGGPPQTCNLTTSDNLYEHRAGTPTAINDRVVVMAP